MTKITGDAGDNVLSGTAAADVIIGGGGKHDELYGLGSNDALTAGDGNDLLDGGIGADTMRGGKGDDTYIVDNTGDKIVESVAKFPGGYDTVFSSVDFSLAKFGNVEALFLQGAGDLKATGNALGNTIWG